MHRLTENLSENLIGYLLLIVFALAAIYNFPVVTKAVSEHLERAVTPEKRR